MLIPSTPAADTEVCMVCDDPNRAPEHPLPQGFTLRTFRPGDENVWVAIHRDGDQRLKVTQETFEDQFGRDMEGMKDRCFFLVSPEGREIGTGTAWYGVHGGRECGRVHWICLVKEQQGRGLAKPLLSAVMKRLARSHDRCYLTTSTSRIAAIGLYLRFGFRPVVTSPEQARAWWRVAGALDHRILRKALDTDGRC